MCHIIRLTEKIKTSKIWKLMFYVIMSKKETCNIIFEFRFNSGFIYDLAHKLKRVLPCFASGS